MSSNDPLQRFEDILENIVLIEQFTNGMSSKEFLEDLKTINATERCLERISEAAKKLRETAEKLCPGIAWPSLRAVGNVLRHEYDKIDSGRIWLMVEDDLPALKASVQSALAGLRSRD